MKKLIVIRHGKSTWDNPQLRDFDRPLNERGRHDAPKVGQKLARSSLMPDKFISSPAKRAITTAFAIAEKIRFPKDEIHQDPNLYGATTSDLLQVLASLDDTEKLVFLVGHNPGLTDFINSYMGFPLQILPTCGICCADFKINSWSEIFQKNGTLTFFDSPHSQK